MHVSLTRCKMLGGIGLQWMCPYSNNNSLAESLGAKARCTSIIFGDVDEELVKHETSELPELVLVSCILSTLSCEYFKLKGFWGKCGCSIY